MFEGFCDKTIDFMWQLRFNNERGWFQAHRQEYEEYLHEPLRALAGEMFGHIDALAPEYGLACKISRINRDTRYGHGGPYRDHMWFSVQRPSEDYSGTLCFWFEIAPEAWDYGLGYYFMRPLDAAKLRARMDRDPAPMTALAERLASQDEFALDGDEYKRPKKAPSPLLQPWYGKKNFSLIHEGKLTDELFSRAVVGRLADGFDYLMPFYRYLCTLESDPQPA